MNTPDNALPNYDKAEIKDPAAFFRTLFHLRDIREERAVPAVVTDCDTKTGEVTVLPMAKYTFDTRDGEAEIDRETVKVRVLKICQGGYSISLPIFKGDTGWLIAGDRRCGTAKRKNDDNNPYPKSDEQMKDVTAKPDDCSLLNFENGFFLPCSFAPDTGNGNSLIIRSIRGKDGKLDTTNTDTAHGINAWASIEIESGGRVNICGNGNRLSLREGGIYYDGESQHEQRFITALRKEGDNDFRMKFVTGNKSGNLITHLSEESDWVPLEGGITIKMITAMTEWKFDQSQYFQICEVLINDQVVCSGHSTTHIIDYEIANRGGNIEDYYNQATGNYEFYFTMGIRLLNPSDYNKTGPCEFRCWNKAYSDFESCPNDEKAVFVAMGNADKRKPLFLVTLNKKTMKWSFSFTGQS